MKVVIFCGGLGMRLRDYSDVVPKSLVPIGAQPILWHLMKFYAAYGFKDFVLCLGYKAEAIKEYFLAYNEALSNDFVFSKGGSEIVLMGRDIDDWRITFVDTGLHTSIGGRLRAVRHVLAEEEMFFANYADGLSDVDLDAYLKYFRERSETGMFLGIRPPHVFHVIRSDAEGCVTEIAPMDHAGLRANGGFFLFRRDIFEYLRPDEDLVEEPFHRLIEERKLLAYQYDGFWASMDTFKDRQRLDDLYAAGDAPWAIWERFR